MRVNAQFLRRFSIWRCSLGSKGRLPCPGSIFKLVASEDALEHVQDLGAEAMAASRIR